jgi:hypothetical protein
MTLIKAIEQRWLAPDRLPYCVPRACNLYSHFPQREREWVKQTHWRVLDDGP